MPIGPWGTFEECVAANADKSSPEGFCAWLEKKLTGAWPSQASKIAPEVLTQFDNAANIALSEALKTLHFQAPQTKTVSGVEVFSVGTWTDSSGEVREWPMEKVSAMAKSFIPGSISLKVGHTSPEFNRQIALAMGAPVELLTGDSSGKGAISLGKIIKLEMHGDKLIADFEGVPAPLADMIESGQYTSVSSEIEFVAGQPRLVAVALLGVEKPAVGNLAGLEAAKIFGQSEGRMVLTFQKGKEKNLGKGDENKFTKDTALKDMLSEFQDGDALTAIAVALGLDPQTASLANVLKAITDLKAGGVGILPEEMKQTVAEHTKLKTDVATLQKTVETQAATIATFEHERRVIKYARMAEAWKGIPGKPEEIGAQLAETEEKAGEKVSQMVISQFQAANKVAEDAGILVSKGTARHGDGTSEAEKKLKEFQAGGLSPAKAVVKLSKENPHLFREYQVANMSKGGNDNGE